MKRGDVESDSRRGARKPMKDGGLKLVTDMNMAMAKRAARNRKIILAMCAKVSNKVSNKESKMESSKQRIRIP